MQKKTGTNNKALRILQLIGSVYLLICTGGMLIALPMGARSVSEKHGNMALYVLLILGFAAAFAFVGIKGILSYKKWKASQSDTNPQKYAFGRLHITTLERHITADSRLAATKQYSYAPPVRRYLCEDCLRWEYQNRIVKRDFALFLFFGLLFLVFGIVLACFGGFSSGTGLMIMNALFFLGAAAFLAAAFWQLRPRKSFTDEDGDVVLASVFAGISTHDIRNLGYYTRAESGKAPNDPLRNR